MPLAQLLIVILIVVIALGAYKCSPEEKSRLEKQMETPQRVEKQVYKNIQDGLQRQEEELEKQDQQYPYRK